jgi:hypothetical protein
MKIAGAVLIWVVLLASVAWVAIWLAFPSVPPDAGDTAVIVAISLVLVLAIRRLIRHLTSR